MTKEDVLRLVEENDVKFIRLQFTDLSGILKNLAITDRQLFKALDGCMFDGSSIIGFAEVERSDLVLIPDPDTFAIIPWRPQQGKVARLICDVYTPDGKPFEGDPRYILKRIVKKASDMGFVFNVGPECEFFLFHTDEEGNPTTRTHDTAGYFDLAPLDMGENSRREICLALEDMGFHIEASHHEVAIGQHEIDFRYSDALDAADKLSTFRMVVKTIAQKHGLHASFMPKPLFGVNGSGLHINMSLSKDGVNVFFDPNSEMNLSSTATSFIAGVLSHIKGITAIANPIVNSYKRLIPGYEAPVYIAWSQYNRSPLIRIPASHGESTRIELRSPDPSCNPYLTIALILAAGLEGIELGMKPAVPVDCNIFNMAEEKRCEHNIDVLPTNLKEALFEMEKDPLIKNTLGEHTFNKYLDLHRAEWNEYQSQIHDWEINRYLTKY